MLSYVLFGELAEDYGASLVAQTVKNLPAMKETRVRSLGGKDPLEKGMATHSSILAWKIPWTEEPSRLQFMGSQRVKCSKYMHTQPSSLVSILLTSLQEFYGFRSYIPF